MGDFMGLQLCRAGAWVMAGMRSISLPLSTSPAQDLDALNVGMVLVGAQELERCGHPASPVRDTRTVQPHFDPAQRAAQHQVVEMAKMPDPEDLAFHLAETGAERHVEAVEDDLANTVGIMAFGHHHRGERV